MPVSLHHIVIDAHDLTGPGPVLVPRPRLADPVRRRRARGRHRPARERAGRHLLHAVRPILKITKNRLHLDLTPGPDVAGDDFRGRPGSSPSGRDPRRGRPDRRGVVGGPGRPGRQRVLRTASEDDADGLNASNIRDREPRRIVPDNAGTVTLQLLGRPPADVRTCGRPSRSAASMRPVGWTVTRPSSRGGHVRCPFPSGGGVRVRIPLRHPNRCALPARAGVVRLA